LSQCEAVAVAQEPAGVWQRGLRIQGVRAVGDGDEIEKAVCVAIEGVLIAVYPQETVYLGSDCRQIGSAKGVRLRIVDCPSFESVEVQENVSNVGSGILSTRVQPM
jgi:hypothetical protein